MMRTKKRLYFAAIGITLVAGLGLSGCTSTPDTPEPTTTSTPDGSAPVNTSTPGTKEEGLAQQITPEDAEKMTELEEAQKAFPDVTQGSDGATKEEIQLALYSAARYVDNIYDDNYLANGSWATDGYDFNVIKDKYEKYWDVAYSSYLQSLVTDVQNNKADANRDLIQAMFFFDPAGQNLTIADDCIAGGTLNSCLKDGVLVYDTGWNYRVSEDGSIFTSVGITANVRFVKDGVEGVSPVRYNLELQMVPNPRVDEAADYPAYITRGVTGDWRINEWTKE